MFTITDEGHDKFGDLCCVVTIRTAADLETVMHRIAEQCEPSMTIQGLAPYISVSGFEVCLENSSFRRSVRLSDYLEEDGGWSDEKYRWHTCLSSFEEGTRAFLYFELHFLQWALADDDDRFGAGVGADDEEELDSLSTYFAYKEVEESAEAAASGKDPESYAIAEMERRALVAMHKIINDIKEA